jgi:NitT/TauT family transport system substrate-binding protein
MLEYYYPWTNSAGIYLARERGYYAERGLDVQIALHDPFVGDTLEYLKDGAVDFGIFPTNRLFVRREQGADVIGVAAINQRGMETIQTVRGKGIATPADLAGKRIALAPTVRGVAMVRHLLAANGADPDNWEIVDSGFRELLAEDIRDSDIDASFGTYWAWDVLLDNTVPDDERVIWPVDTIGAPPYLSYLLGALGAHVRDNPTLVRDFVAATRQGYLDAAAEPQAAAPLYAQAVPFLPEDVIGRSLPLIASTWLFEDQWGVQRDDYQDAYGRWLFDNDILRVPDSWSEAYTNAFV